MHPGTDGQARDHYEAAPSLSSGIHNAVRTLRGTVVPYAHPHHALGEGHLYGELPTSPTSGVLNGIR
jgi:hypothetical protein